MANVSLKTDLDIGSMVEVLSKRDKPTYGLIRWIGFLPNTDKKVAGLELVSYVQMILQSFNIGNKLNCVQYQDTQIKIASAVLQQTV